MKKRDPKKQAKYEKAATKRAQYEKARRLKVLAAKKAAADAAKTSAAE